MTHQRSARAARLVLVVLLVLVMMSGSDERRIEAQEATEIPVSFVEKFLPDATRMAWRGDGQVIAIAQERDIGIYNPSLEAIRRLEGHSDFVYMLDWSADNSRLVSVGADSTLRIWDMDESSPTYSTALITLTESDKTLAVSWSPDGTKLAYSVFESINWVGNSGFTTSVVKIWDVAMQTVTCTLSPQVNSAPDLAWSPDSQQLATSELTDSGYALNLWDVESGDRTATLSNLKGQVNALVWKPDSTRLAVGTQTQGLLLITDTITNPLKAETLVTDPPLSAVYSASWEASGNRLALGDAEHSIQILDTVTSKVLATLTGHRNNVYQVLWSPDGSRLASISSDEIVRIWDVSALDS